MNKNADLETCIRSILYPTNESELEAFDELYTDDDSWINCGTDIELFKKLTAEHD